MVLEGLPINGCPIVQLHDSLVTELYAAPGNSQVQELVSATSSLGPGLQVVP